MTIRPSLPSLTAGAALLAFAAAPALAQDEGATAGATEEQSTTEAATEDMPAAEAMGESSGDVTAADETTPAEAAPADDTVEPGTPAPDMQAVLDKLMELGAPPIGTVSVEEQRAAPTPADAVMAVMQDRGIAPDPALEAIATREVTYPDAGGGEQPIRIYTPEGEGPFPLVAYFHGGGWVIADLDTYDASARALAAGTGAVVASVEYRHAPENKFPAAHEDANAAYAWLIENSGSINADAERVAVAGQSAGANLAINVALSARDAQLTTPDHMLLVYPLINNDLTLPSYVTYADAMPLSKPAVEWFVSHVFESPAETADPRVNVLDRTDLAGLPSATIINAQIDPLLSEGELLAEALTAQGVEAAQTTYEGVTHEFFGMGVVVPQAKEAMDAATGALRGALAVQ